MMNTNIPLADRYLERLEEYLSKRPDLNSVDVLRAFVGAIHFAGYQAGFDDAVADAKRVVETTMAARRPA